MEASSTKVIVAVQDVVILEYFCHTLAGGSNKMNFPIKPQKSH